MATDQEFRQKTRRRARQRRLRRFMVLLIGAVLIAAAAAANSPEPICSMVQRKVQPQSSPPMTSPIKGKKHKE